MRVLISTSLVSMTLSGLLCATLHAQALNGRHPGYLQALADLRQARYFLTKTTGSEKLKAEQDSAIRDVDAAMDEIKKASIDDGKAVTDVAIDSKEHGSPLAKAIETIYKARNDITHEEDNPEVRTLRQQALDHLARAGDSAKQAHLQWLQELKESDKNDKKKSS